MSAGLIIRQPQLSDALSLAQIQVGNYQSDYGGILPPKFMNIFSIEAQEQDWRDIITEKSLELLLVAESTERQVAGYALSRPAEHSPGAFDVELQAMHIAADQRRIGVGTRLLIAVAEHYAKLDFQGLFLWVLADNPASRFYDLMGGERIGEKPWEHNEYYNTDLLELAYGWRDLPKLVNTQRMRSE